MNDAGWQQTWQDLEVVVVDDASTDDTRMIAETHAAQDARVRVLDGPRAGLAAIRNASLEAARGRWAAILDSDDMLHPCHIQNLVAAAQRTGAEIVAANMVSFSAEGGWTRTALFANHPAWQEERWLDQVEYVRANSASGDAVSAGYLKPLFDMEFLRKHSLCYDLRLRIAEDYDLAVRTLGAGARYLYLPHPTYFYRRHAASTSFRQSVPDLMGMLATADSAAAGSADPELLSAVVARTAGIRSALRHAQALDALKGKKPVHALLRMGYDRGAWALMLHSVIEGGRKRLFRRQGAEKEAVPSALLIGVPAPGSQVARAVAELEQGGRPVERRPVPENDRARAQLADGLPPLTEVFAALPATFDDAAYAMAPGIARHVEQRAEAVLSGGLG
ncbi:MAG: glycosyltransferase family 2 protein [Novosphingobium sp.]